MDNHFKLSNSFKNIFSTSKEKQRPPQSNSQTMFKLNPHSANPLENVPVDTLRRKSRTKLESLKDEANNNKFSILNQNTEGKALVEPAAKDKKNQPKKYNLQVQSRTKSKQKGEEERRPEIEILPRDIVRPSQVQQSSKVNEPGMCTLVQTPLLPCFASEFAPGLHQSQFKEVKEKEGVWKIGKMKVKGKSAKLTINGFTFDANLADIEGKAGVVNDVNFYELPKWEGVWVVQPDESLYQ